ncbi:MAG: outer membrane beta-barrel protein [Tannerella sp.]|jgi:hypothetical protein|nr:outer membrane beta-barrel protein [Tannerella sp.]
MKLFIKVLTGISLFALLSTSLKAQDNKIEVTGLVVEKTTGFPIEAATVRLLSGSDSTMRAGVASGIDGKFTLKNIAAGDYLMNVSYIGYHSVYQPIRITGRNLSVNMGKIELEEDAVMLDEAVVIGKAVEVTVKGDTVEYNADSYKLAEGSMLEDLLKKMPGVEVGTDGTVTVNGKQIKRVLVDGKEFFSDDPKVASKNLPAKMVEKVQTYNKLSDMAMMTGFNDGDEEAVINLTIRPGMKQGWFGNAFAGYGSNERYEGNAMVNRFINNDQFSLIGGINNTNNMGFTDLASSMFSDMGGGGRGRRIMINMGGNSGITTSGNIGTNFSKQFNPRFTLGGNIRFSRSDNEAVSKNETENLLPSGNTFDYDSTTANRVNNNLGVNMRMVWKPDTLTQVYITPDFSFSKTNSNEFGTSYTLGSNARDSINAVTSNSGSSGDGLNASLRIEASRKISPDGRVLSLSLSGGGGDTENTGNNYSLTHYFKSPLTPSEKIDQQTDYHNTNYNWRAFASVVEPLGNNNFLQLSYSYSQSKREALKNAYTTDEHGVYNVLDSAYSKSSHNESVEQRASIAFKSQREFYNYTLGFNIDPSYQKTGTFVGDDILYSKSRNVVNWSPTVQFNWNPSTQTNMRIDYEGRTTQPTMLQLQPVEDVSDPLNTTVGNPELKPTYVNSLRLRFQKFLPEQQTAFIVMGSAGYNVNDIVSATTNDVSTGKKYTTYDNINGNYNGNVNFIFNTPLKNKKFSINNMFFANYANTNSFIDKAKNLNTSLQLNERATLNFRSDYADFGVNGSISYRNTKNTIVKDNNISTFNYGVGGNAALYLPSNFKIETDLNYSTNSGYSTGYEQNELLWNASLSKSFMRDNAATLRLKIYDILQQRSNISYSTTSNYTRYSEYNTLKSYVMLHFIYRFSIFKGGGSASDMFRRREGSPDGPPPPQGGGQRIFIGG